MRKLDRALKRNGITPKKLADRTGLSQSMISRIRSGERTPSLPSAVKIARALDIDIGELHKTRAARVARTVKAAS